MRTFVKLAGHKLARFVYRMSNKFYLVLLTYYLSRFIATLLFSDIESWRFLEAVWWSGVASQTIGYGDLAPKTDIGRLVAEGFQTFWTFYTLPLIAGHIFIYLVKNLHIFTNEEQEWLLKTVRIIYDWMRWCVITLRLIAKRLGVEPPPLTHTNENGELLECDEEPPDNDFDELLIPERAQQSAT